MRCSDCGRLVMPAIAMDIDGTLAQYHRHFLEFASTYYDRHFDTAYDGSVELHEWMDLELAEYRTCKLAYRQGGGKRSIPVYPGASGLMNWLRQQNVEIWITTTRPYLRLDSTDPDTRFWLERHKIPYDFLLYSEDKYRIFMDRVDHGRILAIVDDLPEMIEPLTGQLPINRLWMPDRRHNSLFRWPYKFENFSELQTYLSRELETWHANHP